MKLVGETTTRVCDQCKGKGTIPCPPTDCVRTGYGGFDHSGKAVATPGEGCPIPCPKCRGKKVIS